jgi:hypothetical protein
VIALHCEIERERISEIYAMPKTHATHGLARTSAARDWRALPFCTRSGRELKRGAPP